MTTKTKKADIATGLNTTEKRKIEEVVVKELEIATGAFKAQQSQKFDELKENIEKNPSKKALDAVKAYNKLADEFNKKAEAHKATIKNEGYRVGYSYSDSYKADKMEKELDLDSSTRWERNNSIETYKSPILTSHNRETVEGVQKLESLSRLFVMKIFTGEMKADEVMAQLRKEMKEILG